MKWPIRGETYWINPWKKHPNAGAKVTIQQCFGVCYSVKLPDKTEIECFYMDLLQ